MKDDLSKPVGIKLENTPDGSVIVVPANADKKEFWKSGIAMYAKEVERKYGGGVKKVMSGKLSFQVEH